MDERIRKLERDAAVGGPQAQLALKHALRHIGKSPRTTLEINITDRGSPLDLGDAKSCALISHPDGEVFGLTSQLEESTVRVSIPFGLKDGLWVLQIGFALNDGSDYTLTAMNFSVEDGEVQHADHPS